MGNCNWCSITAFLFGIAMFYWGVHRILWVDGIVSKYPNWRENSGSESFNASESPVVGDTHMLYMEKTIDENDCIEAFENLSITFMCSACDRDELQKYPEEVQHQLECIYDQPLMVRLTSFTVYANGSMDVPGAYHVESSVVLFETTKGTQGIGFWYTFVLLVLLSCCCFYWAGCCFACSWCCCILYPDFDDVQQPELPPGQVQEEDLEPGQSFPALPAGHQPSMDAMAPGQSFMQAWQAQPSAPPSEQGQHQRLAPPVELAHDSTQAQDRALQQS